MTSSPADVPTSRRLPPQLPRANSPDASQAPDVGHGCTRAKQATDTEGVPSLWHRIQKDACLELLPQVH